MEAIELKLKQASAVLGVAPKDLQNLVQFKVLRPTRRDSFYWFNNRLLLEAKVALYLKESLGTSTEVLALFARALSGLKDEEVAKLRYIGTRRRGRGIQIPAHRRESECFTSARLARRRDLHLAGYGSHRFGIQRGPHEARCSTEPRGRYHQSAEGGGGTFASKATYRQI